MTLLTRQARAAGRIGEQVATAAFAASGRNDGIVRQTRLGFRLQLVMDQRHQSGDLSNEGRNIAWDSTYVAAETCVALGATEHQFESFPGRDIALGELTVTRVLPVKGRRLVGPWCFLDRFAVPLTFKDPPPTRTLARILTSVLGTEQPGSSTASSCTTTASDTNRYFDQAASMS